MLKEFDKYQSIGKQYQRLFSDEFIELYVGYNESVSRVTPNKFLAVFNNYSSVNISQAINIIDDKVFVGIVDKYLNFKTIDSPKHSDLIVKLENSISELPETIRRNLIKHLTNA